VDFIVNLLYNKFTTSRSNGVWTLKSRLHFLPNDDSSLLQLSTSDPVHVFVQHGYAHQRRMIVGAVLGRTVSEFIANRLNYLVCTLSSLKLHRIENAVIDVWSVCRRTCQHVRACTPQCNCTKLKTCGLQNDYLVDLDPQILEYRRPTSK